MLSSEALRRCLGDCEVSPGQAALVWERQRAETPPGHPKSPASGCSSLWGVSLPCQQLLQPLPRRAPRLELGFGL